MAGGRKRRERGIGERILTVFGDLKVFPHPMFLVYDPKEGKVVFEFEPRGAKAPAAKTARKSAG